ncbi:hematopoietic SH2 domain-containing protein isoform X1 [Equus asinus]|uniref:Hematopoietic SH2 domain containing n=2 Tax=Equus asinus TaxID=9793 RepID=A0A8C4KTL1_EQUAS
MRKLRPREAKQLTQGHTGSAPQEAMTEASKLPPPLPPRLDWFVQTQVDQLAQGGVPTWFHGAISRENAETLLESQPLGCFLIRVSHSHVGYTLSYRAQSGCRHFMVKLLDDGSCTIPGQERAHTSLDALVAFHQQQPLRPHGELLTQPCGQKDPACVDYEDLFLYSMALGEEPASPAHGPRECQNPRSCPVASLEEASAKPVLLRGAQQRQPEAEPTRAPPKAAASSHPQRTPLEKACRKLWRNLKTVPETGRKVQQQLKAQLAAASLSSVWDTGRPAGTRSSGALSGGAAGEEDGGPDPSLSTWLTSPAQPQAPRDRDGSSGRSASWSKATSGARGWHQVVMRALSQPEPRGLAEPQKDWLPEEYRPPPPFAPGYC